MLIKQDNYSGNFIHRRFAYEYFRDKVLPTGNIVAFISPMEVTDNLVDIEDALARDFIYSEKAINFCYELPLTNTWGGVAFQRLFNTMLGDLLARIMKVSVEISGDDIFVCKEFTQGGVTQLRGKASVSIVHEVNGAVLGHTGINIVAGKRAPAFAYSTNMTEEQQNEFIREAIKMFYETTADIFVATTKVI